MKKQFNSTIVDGFLVEGQCRDNSFYVRFNDDDIEELALFAFDMGYALEPEVMESDADHPVRFKIISKADPTVYGWISKVIEKAGDHWQDSFLYGFYRHGSFRIKYPISFNIHSRNMRSAIKHNAETDPKQMIYFRNVFGILDLEPEAPVLDFIFSWLWSVKFQYI